jgi:hypothetical protein
MQIAHSSVLIMGLTLSALRLTALIVIDLNGKNGNKPGGDNDVERKAISSGTKTSPQLSVSCVEWGIPSRFLRIYFYITR